MGRYIIQIARIRAADAELGDVIARDHEASIGWFVLRQIDRLHDGKVNLSDGGVNNSFALFPVETIGLQIAKNVQVEQQPRLPDVPVVGGEVIIAGPTDDDDDVVNDDDQVVNAGVVNAGVVNAGVVNAGAGDAEAAAAGQRQDRRRPTAQGATREAAREATRSTTQP